VTGRRRCHASLLLFLAVVGVACNIKIGTDAENDCVFYHPPPIVLPSQATLLTDTLDLRTGHRSFFLTLEGYEQAGTLGDNISLHLVLPQSDPPASFTALLYPEPSTSGLFAGDVLGEPPTGEYHITHLLIERWESSCTMSGMDTWIRAGLTPADMGMTDSVFVILSNF